MARRAYTLVELLLVIALTAMILGALTSLYIFATQRTAYALSDEEVLTQTDRVLGSMTDTISQATSCSMVALGSGTALKCTMPNSGSDFDGDGYMDTFQPLTVSRRCVDYWGEGQRIWFYQSDSSGDPNNAGTYLWRAVRTDDSIPTVSDSDSKWTFYYGGAQGQSDLVRLNSCTVNTAAQTVTLSLSASELTRDHQVASATDSADSQSLSVTRTIYWRHWRQ